MTLEMLETYQRRLEATLAELVHQADQLDLIGSAVPDPAYDEVSGEPGNFAAEVQLSCRIARDGLSEARAALLRLLERVPVGLRGIAS